MSRKAVPPRGTAFFFFPRPSRPLEQAQLPSAASIQNLVGGYLPPKKNLKVDSAEFHRVKQRLARVEGETRQEHKNHPTLRRGPDCPEEEMEKISKSE